MRVKFVQTDASAFDAAPVIAELLGIEETTALGMLNFIWRGALGHAHHSDKKPSGIVGGPARFKLLAAWAKWRASPDKLAEALEVTGFLEHLPDERFRIRGTSRYWSIITRNSRPNARTRAKQKAAEEAAQKGQKAARAGHSGPKAGQAEAFNYNSNSKPLRSKGTGRAKAAAPSEPQPDPAIDSDFASPQAEENFSAVPPPTTPQPPKRKAANGSHALAVEAVPVGVGEEKEKPKIRLVPALPPPAPQRDDHEAQLLWDGVCKEIVAMGKRYAMSEYLGKLWPISLRGDTLELGASDTFQRDFVLDTYEPLLLGAIQAITQDVQHVEVVVAERPKPLPLDDGAWWDKHNAQRLERGLPPEAKTQDWQKQLAKLVAKIRELKVYEGREREALLAAHWAWLRVDDATKFGWVASKWPIRDFWSWDVCSRRLPPPNS